MKRVNFVLAFAVMFIFIFASCEKENNMNKTEDTVKLEERLGVELSKVADSYVLDGVTGTLYQTTASGQDIFIANKSMEKGVVTWEHTTRADPNTGTLSCSGPAVDCKIYTHDDGIMIRYKPASE